MSINIIEKIYNYVSQGYSEDHARSRVTQDIVLHKIAHSNMRDNITIKGGVIMFNLTKHSRRATLDIDIDFIRYSISNESIEHFFQLLNQIDDGITLILQNPIRELKQQDYKGKRILFSIKDEFNNVVSDAKIDLGVHNNISINQDEFTFYLESLEEGVVLNVNSKEQIFSEKLLSLLRHGLRSTRYKDIYDLFYLISETNLDVSDVLKVFNKMEISNNYPTLEIIQDRIRKILNNPVFARNASKPNNDWIEIDYDLVVNTILDFLSSFVTV